MLDKDNQMQDYASFLESKFKFSKSYGFEIDKKSINPMLKPHQTEIVHWAVAKGRAAIFASFGLGKSFMQIETLHQLSLKESS